MDETPGGTGKEGVQSKRKHPPVPVDENLPFLGMDLDSYWEFISHGDDEDYEDEGKGTT